MPRNLCTCPAAVDITFIGHLPGCPQPAHEQRCFRRKFCRPLRPKVAASAELKQQLAIVRRQLTFARKRLRQLERERDPKALRVVRWAKRFVRHGNDWDRRQLAQAVKALPDWLKP